MPFYCAITDVEQNVCNELTTSCSFYFLRKFTISTTFDLNDIDLIYIGNLPQNAFIRYEFALMRKRFSITFTTFTTFTTITTSIIITSLYLG